MSPGDQIDELLAGLDEPVRRLTVELRALVRHEVPDALEEVDLTAKPVGFTFQPGTYSGLFAAAAPKTGYVNLMFSAGVELLDQDTTGLLEGSGKKARHIKVRGREQLDDPHLVALIGEAARRTRR